MLSPRHRYRFARPVRKRRPLPQGTRPIFIDGPAVGEILPITRAPRFLRVTQNGPCFRALDQPGHEPEETELIYVYQLQGKPSEKPARANPPVYQYLPSQPMEKQIRRTPSWRGWTISQSKEYP